MKPLSYKILFNYLKDHGPITIVSEEGRPRKCKYYIKNGEMFWDDLDLEITRLRMANSNYNEYIIRRSNNVFYLDQYIKDHITETEYLFYEL